MEGLLLDSKAGQEEDVSVPDSVLQNLLLKVSSVPTPFLMSQHFPISLKTLHLNMLALNHSLSMSFQKQVRVLLLLSLLLLSLLLLLLYGEPVSSQGSV